MAYYIRLSYDHRHQWQVPSGRQGKSTNPNTHEHQFGFGFEEWNFNKRRFTDESRKTGAHFGYVQAFNRIDRPDEGEDLVLYTLESNGRNVVNRYIVARIKAGSWRFIDHDRYQVLSTINNAAINQMNAELGVAYQQGIIRDGLKLGDLANRFNEQRNCQDWYGQTSDTYRLWNIEFLKPIKIIKQRVNENTPCPDWHVNTLKMFNLYNNNKFNHKNCK